MAAEVWKIKVNGQDFLFTDDMINAAVIQNSLHEAGWSANASYIIAVSLFAWMEVFRTDAEVRFNQGNGSMAIGKYDMIHVEL